MSGSLFRSKKLFALRAKQGQRKQSKGQKGKSVKG
jgi:hypothetical protein